MGIKEQLIAQIKGVGYSAYDVPSVLLDVPPVQAGFVPDVLGFLNADTYATAWELAPRVLRNATAIHGKWEDSIESLVRAMDTVERTAIERPEHRLHLLHLVNVFLLGLYLYDISERVRTAVDKWAHATTPPKKYLRNGEERDWLYSGGSPHGEFLYRWRLAATAHDIGTFISVAGKDRRLVRERLMDLFDRCGATDSDGSRRRSTAWNLRVLHRLNRGVAEFSLLCHAITHHVWPFRRAVYREHGLHGALILMEAMRLRFKQHGATGGAAFVEETDGGLIIWDECLMETSIRLAAQAVALHNVDIHAAAHIGGHLPPMRLLASAVRCAQRKRLYDLDERPLAWLLKVSDSLQEWDKPKLRELGAAVDLDKRTDAPAMEISWDVALGRFIVRGLTPEQAQRLSRVEELTSPQGLFQFIQTS